MRITLVTTFLLCIAGCNPAPEVSHDSVAPTAPPSPVRTFEGSVANAAEATFFQRFANNNHWDDGKPMELDVAKQIIELLRDSTEYDPVADGDIVAVGVAGPQYYFPGFTSSMKMTAPDTDAAVIEVTFCFNAEHFMDGSDSYFVVPENRRRSLKELLELLHDDDRNPPR